MEAACDKVAFIGAMLLIPLCIIAGLGLLAFVLEFLRRERTTRKDDDWMSWGDSDKPA